MLFIVDGNNNRRRRRLVNVHTDPVEYNPVSCCVDPNSTTRVSVDNFSPACWEHLALFTDWTWCHSCWHPSNWHPWQWTCWMHHELCQRLLMQPIYCDLLVASPVSVVCNNTNTLLKQCEYSIQGFANIWDDWVKKHVRNVINDKRSSCAQSLDVVVMGTYVRPFLASDIHIYDNLLLCF